RIDYVYYPELNYFSGNMSAASTQPDRLRDFVFERGPRTMGASPVRVAGRILAMDPSPTVSIDGRAKEMRAAGIDVVNFSAGEPDFPTPENIKDAAKRALDENQTRYTPVAGTPELRQAVATKLRRDNGLEYEAG